MTAPVITPADESRLPIDAATIRETYETAVHHTANTPETLELLKSKLVGQVELLILAVRAVVPRMQELSRRKVAELVLRRAREHVDARPGPGESAQASHLFDLATACRALLTLHQYPGALDEDAGQ
ncbi:DUF6415 family natural product biosynthesis protein [Streptomyces afghaniensis]|uniref:DUF6415 family natural product biosynthesis protein n=1 Tax=Streptomyces afghaniensis TaxID=66865 RepID=UPI0027841D26|nr:DUF6415 family natural product biosynthesis protein [Streptomyces afghaniensis]MDQ1018998.1 hypothetical protein [Streptomyces afghaniensis]